MELVKQFNSELSSLYESKPPISKAKMTSITRTAIKAIKLYKHVVQSVEKFIQKCKPEYKVPGLYVIDSIVRQSRHQFGTEKDVFAPRFARNLQQTFVHLFNCPPEDKSKVIRVLNLWQKNAVFESEVIQPLFDLADPNHPVHKEQAAVAPSNGITPVKPVPAANITPKNVSTKKEGGTTNWINQLHSDANQTSVHSSQVKSHGSAQVVDVNIIQQLQQLQSLLMDQQSEKTQTKDADQIKFDKKLLDFDYGEEEDEDGTPAQHHHQQQQQMVASLDSIGSILSNPEVLRQLQTLQQTLTNPQHLRQQQLDMEEKIRKMQEMKQQEEEFDKHLAQTVPNLPFADECDLKPSNDLSSFPGMDLSQPPPGYPQQQKMMVHPGMMMKPPPSPLEDGEHASSDADERMGRPGDDGGPSVVVLDSDSPSDSPAHGRRRRRRSRSRSRSRRSRSDSRSRSRGKRKRSSSYDDKDWEKVKLREVEKERERERKRRGLPPLKKNHLAVCSTTLWIGHLSKLVQQEELSDTFGEFGDIVSIDLIPPRGCAFICMNRRQDAYRALQDLKHHKLQGKAITLAWAPGKGMKGKEYKDYWEVEQGVSYIPWHKLTHDIDIELLEEGGMIDEESYPEWLREKQKKKEDDNQRSQSSSQAGDDDTSKGTELDIPVPAPTLPGFIPLPDGPQPTDIKVNQAPPNMPPMMGPGPGSIPPPLGMMPPFGLPPREYTGLLGPMGMPMGPPGLMTNVPLGVPPPGMQGLMGNPLMHQQMMSRMPQPVGSPFNPPPGVGILGGHPQLSQIPLPGSQDKKPLGVPPPTEPPGLPPFDSMMQLPFTLPPQLQMPGIGMLQRPPVQDKSMNESNEHKNTVSPARNDAMNRPPPFGQPPQFSPMALMKIPPPMAVPIPNKPDNSNMSEDKDEREIKDKDYRDSLKDYKDRDKDRDRDRDYRNKRDRDYRGDRDYRDRFDKDYRERDKDYRDRRDRRDRSRDRDDKSEQDFREKDGKTDEKDRKDDSFKDDKNYRDRNDRDKGRNRERERDRDRDRGRDRINKWGDRDRERGRDRDREDRRGGRDRERDHSKEIKGSGERDKGGNSVQDRLRNMAHEQDRCGEFSRGSMEPDNFQGPGGSKFGARNEGFHQDGFPPDMHGRHPGNRRDVFDNRGPRDMFDHRGPPTDGFDPRGPPPDGFGPRGVLPMDNFGPRGPPPGGFGPRGPPPEGFGTRGPPPDSFGSRGPPPDEFDIRGPPPGGFGPPNDGFGPRGPPPDFDGQGPPGENFNMRGPPPDKFNRVLLPDNFGPGGPPPEGFPHRGPPGDEFGPHGHPPFEGFNGPHGQGDFQPRIRIEFFARGRGRGGLQDNFRGRGARGGAMFSPRGAGPRGPRPGIWMDSEGPSPPKSGFGFPPRGFAPSEGGSERFGPPVFEEPGRGRGQNVRGRGRGFQGRVDEHRREDEEAGMPSPKRLSRWSNPSPPPLFTQSNIEDRLVPEPRNPSPPPSLLQTTNQDRLMLEPRNPSPPPSLLQLNKERLISDELPDSSEPMEFSEPDVNEPKNVDIFSEEEPKISRTICKLDLDLNPLGSDVTKESNLPFNESIIDSQSSAVTLITRRNSVAMSEENRKQDDIGNEYSAMELSNNDAIQEKEINSLFTQVSQSATDVEMLDTHVDFIGADSRNEHLQPSDSQSQVSEVVERRSSFTDVGFSEAVSFTQNNECSSQLVKQPSLNEAEKSDTSCLNLPSDSYEPSQDDSFSRDMSTPTDQMEERPTEYKSNETVEKSHVEPRFLGEDFLQNVDSCLPQSSVEQTNTVHLQREEDSSFVDNLNQSDNFSQEQNSICGDGPKEALDSVLVEQRLSVVNEPESQDVHLGDLAFEPQPHVEIPILTHDSTVNEGSESNDPPVLLESNNSVDGASQ